MCRRDGRPDGAGNRTSVRISVGAVPVGASARDYGSPRRAERQGDEGAEAARLADAWAREAPAARNWREMPTAPADDECPECGEAMLWHSAHTALVCLGCEFILESPSPHVAERAGAHADALARKRAGVSREVAVIDPGAEARARAARVDVHRTREAVRRYADEALTWCEPGDYQRIQFQRLAYGVGATIRGYLPEITAAADGATLAEILRELEVIRHSSEFGELVAESDREEREAERAKERADYLARQAEIEAERAAAERQARAEQQRAAKEQARIAARQQRQLPAARQPSANTYALAQFAKMVTDYQRSQEQKKQAIAQRGTCGFCRKPTPATRVYGIAAADYGWMPATTVLNAQAEHIRACDKHHDDADSWITQRYPNAARYWWET